MPNLEVGTPGSALRSLLITTIFCTSIATLLAVIRPAMALLDSLVISLSIGLTINTILIVAPEFLYKRLGLLITTFLLTAAGLTIGLMFAGVVLFSNPLIFFTEQRLSLILGVFFAIVGVLIFGTRARLAESQTALAEAKLAAQHQQTAQTETELRLLQAQIEPHFLFNTLSNVVGLIHKDPHAAEDMLRELTTFLRSSLDRTRAGQTTVAQELAIVEAYLSIHSKRMHERLTYQIDHDADTLGLTLAPLLLQPLVENAVAHGIDPLEKGGQISVTSRLTEGMLTLTVTDNGVGLEAQQAVKRARLSSQTDTNLSERGGTGLTNVRARLNTLYGSAASLSLQPNEPNGLVATLHIPIQTSDPELSE